MDYWCIWIQHKTYTVKSERQIRINLNAEVENRLVDTVGEGRGGMK